MGGTGVATLVKTSNPLGSTAAQHKPLGLGSSGLPGHAAGVVARPSRQLRRQWTTAKPGGDVSCNVLPLFLDLSLAFAPGLEFFDAVKSSVDSEVVFQATLQVPAHHALACRMSAYGTPFAAPDLQAAAHELGDEDLEFAACLASPPDLDEQLSVNFGRVMSLLERNQQGGQQQQAATITTRGGASANPAQQVLRATPGGAQQQQAPKVLVSVDEAESGAAQLQRQSSAKKQPRGVGGFAKRSLQALLGLGYLLTVLHEKSLGGRIEFSAALTAASIISPQTSNGHVRRRTNSSAADGSLGNVSSVLAGLRQMMECPSLSPLASGPGLGRSRLAAGAAAAAAASVSADGGRSLGGAGSPLARGPQPSFEAAWERVLHPSLSGGGSGGAAASRAPAGAAAAAAAAAAASGSPGFRGLQLQLSLRTRSHSADGAAPSATPTPGATPTAAGRALQGRLPCASDAADGVAFVASSPCTGLPAAWGTPQQQQKQGQGQDGLFKMDDLGRSSSVQAALDAAVAHATPQQQREASAFATPAAAAAVVEADAAAASASPAGSPGAPAPRSPQLSSFYLPDQAALTSPLAPAAWAAAGAATPAGSPCLAGAGSSGSSSAADTPRRLLMPVMSMRLTCQPAWQSPYAEGRPSGSGACGSGSAGDRAGAAGDKPRGAAASGATPAGALAAAAAAAAEPQPPSPKPQHKQGVHMHAMTPQERQQLRQQQPAPGALGADGAVPLPSFSSPFALWPTMSFSLVPVRLPPKSPSDSGGQGAFRASHGAAGA